MSSFVVIILFAVSIMIPMTSMAMLLLRVKPLSTFAVFGVLPFVAFAGNKGKHTGDGECAKNDLFHVRRLHSASRQESKASLPTNLGRLRHSQATVRSLPPVLLLLDLR